MADLHRRHGVDLRLGRETVAGLGLGGDVLGDVGGRWMNAVSRAGEQRALRGMW